MECDKPLKQRSTEWFKLRAGMVTASQFAVTLKQPRSREARDSGEMSESAKRYLEQLVAELIVGEPCGQFQSRPTDWGREWEETAFEQAKIAIAERYGEVVESPVGDTAFMFHPDEHLVGCSPDGTIGSEGLLELKCPYNPAIGLRTRLEGYMPKIHTPQVQGSLWVSGMTWYGFGTFDPRFKGSAIEPLFLVRIERDDDYIDNELAPAVRSFRNRVLDVYEKLPEIVRRNEGRLTVGDRELIKKRTGFDAVAFLQGR